MPYTEELKRLIENVERTRPERLAKKREGKEIPPMSLEERDKILRKHHPDYKDEGKREVKVGPSKGYKLPDEIVDLLEAKSRVDPDAVDLSQVDYETDVLVIGGGGAGTAAALLAEEQGAKVIISNKLRHGDSNTIMAEGGVQAATKFEKDSPVIHYLDTLGGGRFKNDPEIVHTLVTKAADLVQWLEGLGVLLNKFPEGRLQSMPAAGYCRKRLHYASDITGTEIMRTIRDEARNRENITVLEFSPVVELLLNEHGQCAGAIIYDLETEEYYIIKAKAVVISTGGQGRIHIAGFMTTNHYGATADGIVLGYRVGIGLRDLHAVQYHPTGVVFPEQLEGALITEKFRAAGANVVNIDGEQFVFEREPRDVESAAFVRECLERGKGVPSPTGKIGLWLDSPMLEDLYGEGTVEKEFPGKVKQFKRHGFDISREPMLVYPTLHYQNGGLVFNSDTETSVPGLFAAGEVTGGVHGENRLMGNSLLGVHLFGRIAGTNAAIFAKEKAKEGKL
ncbi:MAG: FAD-binding protein, partial [Desulfobacteraceae bacterium]|nr:FAD-binding protein [Desulfobacteraceae bacterium]